MDTPAQRREVSGKAMLLVTAVVVAAILALAWLAGPFGREPLLKQQPMQHWPSSEETRLGARGRTWPQPPRPVRTSKARLLTWVKAGAPDKLH